MFHFYFLKAHHNCIRHTSVSFWPGKAKHGWETQDRQLEGKYCQDGKSSGSWQWTGVPASLQRNSQPVGSWPEGSGQVIGRWIVQPGLQEQGPAGRDFQLSGISGSGIAKNFGFGSGIGYICKKKLSIGYFRVLKILIGYFRVHPNIAQFLYGMLIYVTDFSYFLRRDAPFHLKVSLAPLAQRQYMVFTVVSFEWVNKDTNEKCLLFLQALMYHIWCLSLYRLK